MAKVFSWKINNEEYAYVFIPNKKGHLSSRITDSDTINIMVDKISLWDEKKYKTAFNEMNKEILEKYGFEIPYDSSYFGSSNTNKNVVLLGSSKENNIDNIKSELLDEINNRFEIILNEFNSLYNELLNKANNQVINSINLSKQANEETLSKISMLKTDMTKKFNKSIEKLDKATKVLELDDNNINADSLKNLFSTVSKTNDWVESISGDIKTISREYKDIEKKLTIEEKEEGVFKTFKNRIDNANLLLDDDKNEIKSLKSHVKIIEDEQIKLKENNTKKDIVLGSSMNINPLKRGNFSLDVNDDEIVIENQKTKNRIIVNDDGIKLFGDIYINGVRI
jgi:hypothetical protein